MSPRRSRARYVAAKHGLYGLTKTVALEGATFNVRANCISPGYVHTPLVENQIPDTMKARNMTREQVINDVLLAAQPTKEFVKAEDIGGSRAILARRTPQTRSTAPRSISMAVGRRSELIRD